MDLREIDVVWELRIVKVPAHHVKGCGKVKALEDREGNVIGASPAIVKGEGYGPFPRRPVCLIGSDRFFTVSE